MRKLFFIQLILLLLVLNTAALAAQASLVPVFTHEFIPVNTPAGQDSDLAYMLRADGEGGLYALTRDWLYHWQPGEDKLRPVAANGPLMLTGLACQQDQVYAISIRQGLYRLGEGAWQHLGLPPFLNPASSTGPAHLNAGMAASSSHLFFFCSDREQEQLYLCTYELSSGAFFYEASPVFNRPWVCCLPESDVLVGTAEGEKGASWLVMYDYQTRTTTKLGTLPFSGELCGYDARTGVAMTGGYEGILLGPDDANMMLVLGSPRRLGILAWIQEGLVAASIPRRKEQNAMICVYQFNEGNLQRLETP